MEILRTKEAVRHFVTQARDSGKRIGLVPTMGALHEGHISLARQAVAECDVVMASVFVNPTQFNNPRDLATYPRSESRDFALLEAEGVDAVFAPSVGEIYPDGPERRTEPFNLGDLETVMEGKYRPGHFQGVAQIVSLLFRLVMPDKGYFGRKDFQQIAVIRRMCRTEGLDVEVVACPIVRAADGLALSSRNALLTDHQRALAPGIYAALRQSVDYARTHCVADTRRAVIEQIEAIEGCRVEYYEIVDEETLRPIEDWQPGRDAVGCVTVHCGPVRLIDNISYPHTISSCS